MLDHEIISLPSASTLAVLRRELSDRTPAPKAFAVFADPVFETADPRVDTTSDQTKPIEAGSAPNGQPVRTVHLSELEQRETERSLTELLADDKGSIRRLPFTRREARSIVGLVGRTDTLEALDFDANRSLAMSPEIGHYKYLHFATHAVFNNEHPELSGIVLSLVSKSGGEQDGFLKAYEIYNLKLNADLVVLSSCRTALGREVKGEGLLGLTRGFMYAGAARVLASLWNVSDEATAELMTSFYQSLLSSRQSSPASAIRAAQIKMWNTKRWHSPYYWAGFALQGEPR
jgi:CHAT domain-containing protein